MYCISFDWLTLFYNHLLGKSTDSCVTTIVVFDRLQNAAFAARVLTYLCWKPQSHSFKHQNQSFRFIHQLISTQIVLNWQNVSWTIYKFIEKKTNRILFADGWVCWCNEKSQLSCWKLGLCRFAVHWMCGTKIRKCSKMRAFVRQQLEAETEICLNWDADESVRGRFESYQTSVKETFVANCRFFSCCSLSLSPSLSFYRHSASAPNTWTWGKKKSPAKKSPFELVCNCAVCLVLCVHRAAVRIVGQWVRLLKVRF